MSTADITIFFLAFICILVLAWATDRRLDDLEARITTFETIRIEYVAPVSDSG